jgi:outer membrane biosynthesis protein TonB
MVGGIIDTEGHIGGLKVLKSIPALDEPTLEAWAKWIYEPFLLEGRPSPFATTVTTRFSKAPGPAHLPMKPPSPIHQPSPSDPEDAKRSSIEGTVLIAVTIDEQGGLPRRRS